MHQRQQEINEIWKRYSAFYRLSGAFAFILIGVGIGWLLFADHASYGMNLWTELVGVAFTFLVLDWWTRQRDERRDIEREKAQLMRELGSRHNGTALRAAEALKANGWLMDGTLREINLSKANLEGADLKSANLEHAYLRAANLQHAILYHANLHGASMGSVDIRDARVNVANMESAQVNDADLRGAMLRHVNLNSAFLYRADLQNADLEVADLRGAELIEANLEGVILDGAQFNTETVLPDGYHWTPQTDLGRFTSPNHSNFWRPTDDSWLSYEDDSAPPWWLRGKKQFHRQK